MVAPWRSLSTRCPNILRRENIAYGESVLSIPLFLLSYAALLVFGSCVLQHDVVADAAATAAAATTAASVLRRCAFERW